MFAKGPQAGATPKADALALLPRGTVCRRVHGAGMSACSVQLANGRQIAAAGNANQAWSKAHGWALRHPLSRPQESIAAGS